MHDSAYKLMQQELTRWRNKNAKVLDVGSLDVNGNYRGLIEGNGWSYTGLDIKAGPNVDVVSHFLYSYPLNDESFDIVISGSTAEHVFDLVKWINELVRILDKGGLLIIVTHWQFPEHKYPVDCWRILPDGMEFLFDQTRCLTDYHIEKFANGDIVGSALKKR